MARSAWILRCASICTRVPWVVTVPLILLAIPSALIGWFTVKPLLFGDYFDGSIRCCPAHEVLKHLGEEFHEPGRVFLVGAHDAALVARLGRRVRRRGCSFTRSRRWRMRPNDRSSGCIRFSINKYGFDWFNEHVIMPAARALGRSACGEAAMRP